MSVLEAVSRRDLVLDSFPPEVRSDSAVQSLACVVERLLDAKALGERLDASVALARWMSAGGQMPGTKQLPVAGGRSRLDGLVWLLEGNAELRAAMHAAMGQIVGEMRSVELFAEAGLQPHGGLGSEAIRRVTQWILPAARRESDLGGLIARLYPNSKAIERLLDVPDDVFERLVRALCPVNDVLVWATQRADLRQAFQLLAVHVAGIGLSPGMRERSFPNAIENSPYYQLQQATAELVRGNG
ncbi:MAG TPA: hypothetical protein VGL00_22225, partial [Terracidiphilus sp.]